MLNTLFEHRSIRRYRDQAVEAEKLDNIIRAVQAAPNWVNMQHVSVIAVTDPARKARFAELCGGQAYVAQAPVFLIFCADFYRTFLACRQHGQDFAPVLQDPDMLIVGANEVGIALGTATIAAEMQGLGTVPIGDVRLNALAMIDELALPQYVLPMVGLCVGYAAEQPTVRPRLPKSAVFFEDKYQTDLAAPIAEYDRIYADYLKNRPWNNRVGNWTQQVADFYPEDYNHYPQVPEMLKKQGFGK